MKIMYYLCTENNNKLKHYNYGKVIHFIYNSNRHDTFRSGASLDYRIRFLMRTYVYGNSNHRFCRTRIAQIVPSDFCNRRK